MFIGAMFVISVSLLAKQRHWSIIIITLCYMYINSWFWVERM